MSTPTLYGLAYSPWTERARWALDHHNIAHRYREHVPMLGEPVLRLLARKSGQQVATVPLYRDGQRVLGDSLQILRHADAIGSGPTLLPEGLDVAAWHARVEAALLTVRKRVTRNTLESQAALTEAASAAVPSAVASLFKPVAVMGARHFARKYRFDPNEISAEAEAEALRPLLKDLRGQIGDGDYVGDAFSAIDILATNLLQAVEPCPNRYIALGPATREAWRLPPLVDEFADLIAWRDRLYTRHR